jgi:hypothetical protein
MFVVFELPLKCSSKSQKKNQKEKKPRAHVGLVHKVVSRKINILVSCAKSKIWWLKRFL